MRQEFRWHIKSFIAALCDCIAEMEGVPVDDDCGEQIQPGDPVMLALCVPGKATSGAIAQQKS